MSNYGEVKKGDWGQGFRDTVVTAQASAALMPSLLATFP